MAAKLLSVSGASALRYINSWHIGLIETTVKGLGNNKEATKSLYYLKLWAIEVYE